MAFPFENKDPVYETMALLRDYQKEFISDPILNEIRKPSSDMMNVVSAGTGSGKTHTIVHNIIPTIFKEDLADIVIFTCPNDASLEDIESLVSAWLPESGNPDDLALVYMKDAFGNSSVNMRTFSGPTIVVAHPTAISQNAALFKRLGKKYRIVGISDEAHIGLQSRGAEEYMIAYGYPSYVTSEDDGAWLNTILEMGANTWFLITATPRNTIKNSSWMKLLSVCPKEKTLEFHSLNRGVNFYPVAEYSELIEELVAEQEAEYQEMKDIHAKYGLEIAKAIIGIQGMAKGSFASSHEIYDSFPARDYRGKVAIVVSKRKEIKGLSRNQINRQYGSGGSQPKAAELFDGLSDKTKDVYIVIATKHLDNAVNIPSMNLLISTNIRAASNDLSVTASVEQFMGRANRFPKVKGISNMREAVAAKLKAIKDGVPKEIAERWFEVTFGYTIFLPDTPQNRAGAEAFCKNQTLSADDWKDYLNTLESDILINGSSENVLNVTDDKEQSARNWGGIKSPWAQPGDLSYKNEKGCLCERCPRDENGVPQCAATFHALGYTEEEYFESLDVNHKNGDHTDNRPENLETLCANMHRAITKREKHATNLQYRDNIVNIS